MWNWYLDAICLHLEAVHRREILRLLITQPPNTLKSTVFSVCWPAWIWANDPGTRFLWAANDGPLATRDSTQMRELVTSRWYTESFAPRWAIRSDQDEKTWFSNTSAGHRISYSVNAKVTGKKGDILGIDDANDAKKVWSKVARDAVGDWFDLAYSNRTTDEKTSPIVIVGQRLHVDDLIGRQKKRGGWVELRLDEEFDPDNRCVTPIWSDPRQVAGELLRPERFGALQVIAAKAALGGNGYRAQHRQDPRAAEGSSIKPEWLKFAEQSPAVAARVRYWDKAGTQDGGCYTVGVLMARSHDGLYRVEDVQRAQLSSLGREDLIANTAKLDSQRHPGGVTTVIEQEPGSGGKESAEQTVRRLAGYDVHIDRVTGDKEFRGRPFAAQVEAGNVVILERPWTPSYVDEITTFPNSEYADQFDASSGSFNWLTLKCPIQENVVSTGGEGSVLDQLPSDIW